MLVNAILISANIILWIVLSLRLRKKLSPEGIIKDVRKEMESLLLQINSASDRNIRLIQDQISQAKTASAEARQLCDKVEERLAMLYGEAAKLSSVKATENLLYPPAPPAKSGPSENVPVPPADAPEATVGPAVEIPRQDTLNKASSPLGSYMKEQMRFSENPAPAANEPARKVEIPEFIKPERPIEVKKSFRQQVFEMKSLGYSAEEIAHKTGRSVQEVKITIEIS